MPRPPKINWSLVDWSKTDTEISNSTGVCPSRVGRARKTLAPRTFSDGRRGRPALLTGVDWIKVDLSRPTAELARELGVSQTGVRRQKQKIARNATEVDMPRIVRSALCGAHCADRIVRTALFGPILEPSGTFRLNRRAQSAARMTTDRLCL